MDNIQLSILIDKYLAALEGAIVNVESELPKEEVKISTVMGLRIVTYPILDDLYSLKSTMEHDIKMLTEGSKT